MNRSSQRVCGWAGDDPLMRGYHDKEWGVPVHDDRRLFEFLTLWRFVNGKPLQNRRRSLREVPARTPVSDALSVDLRKAASGSSAPRSCTPSCRRSEW